MKNKILLAALLFVVVSSVWMGNSNWHLNRNMHNKLPVGELVVLSGSLFEDESGAVWILEPQAKNIFHQPDEAVAPIANPYPILDTILELDVENPNLKFLCSDASGGSYEAILQPNGEWITRGILQGTYNFAHPNGVWGSIKHFFADMIPGFVNSQYNRTESY